MLCFDTLLEVFILKGLRWRQNRAKWVLNLKGLTSKGMLEEACSRSAIGPKKKEEFNAETPRPGRGERRTQRGRREEGGRTDRANWSLTIKAQGSTIVNACQG